MAESYARLPMEEMDKDNVQAARRRWGVCGSEETE
jgi:hypothetical protein